MNHTPEEERQAREWGEQDAEEQHQREEDEEHDRAVDEREARQRERSCRYGTMGRY